MGLTINSGTGIISGSPITPQANSSYTITASNGRGQSSVNLQISVGGNFGVGAITITTAGTLTMTLGELSITGSINLDGNNLIVSANNLSRVMNITGANVTLSNFTLRDAAVAGNGGGIAFSGKNLILASSLLQSNYSGNRGGVLYTASGVSANQVVVRDTHFETNNGNTHAGGIEGFGGQSIIIESSSFNGNTGSFGTIVNFGPPMTISKSTIVAANNLRALFVIGPGYSFNVTDSTIFGAPGDSGLVSNLGDATDVTLLRTIIVTTNGGSACNNPMTSLGYNISQDATCSLSGPGDLPNQVVGNIFTGFVLAQVGNTYILPLKVASPALDTGGVGCGITDQRGLPRPVNSGGGLFCDIGAYEQQ